MVMDAFFGNIFVAVVTCLILKPLKLIVSIQHLFFQYLIPILQPQKISRLELIPSMDASNCNGVSYAKN